MKTVLHFQQNNGMHKEKYKTTGKKIKSKKSGKKRGTMYVQQSKFYIRKRKLIKKQCKTLGNKTVLRSEGSSGNNCSSTKEKFIAILTLRKRH
jgi:hypothetical protein